MELPPQAIVLCSHFAYRLYGLSRTIACGGSSIYADGREKVEVCQIFGSVHFEDEERTAHDEEIHEDEHPTQRDVVIFVHDGGDDLRSTRTSIVQEDDGER